MSNRQIEAAWGYHNGTMHPDGALMSRAHGYDPTFRPLPFKIYTELEPIPLPPDQSPAGVSALEAIAMNPASEGMQTPDLRTLARILYFSAGITKKLVYPWGEMLFRAAACTGALYHIELYLVCGELPDLEAGVYHFSPHDLALRRLRSGDYRRVLVEASGNEPAVANAPAVIVYSDVFWRNACKYQAREYRHAFWDSGTILANSLAMAAAHNIPARVVLGFADEAVNGLLDLDMKREVALALLPLGNSPNSVPPPAPDVAPLGLATMPISDYGIDFPAIREMHVASSLADPAEVREWREAAPVRTLPSPKGQLFTLKPYDELPKDSIEEVMVRRGSTRRFAREAISFVQLSTILHQATKGVPGDFLEPHGATLNDIYLIVNAVDGLEAGAYVFHREREALEPLKVGDFRGIAGYLGLQQALPADASANLFFMADLASVLERFGNRGYRVVQLDASITAGRVYLAAYALGIGATGLTFFDDAVTEFFSPHAQGKSTMFLVAVGKKAKRR